MIQLARTKLRVTPSSESLEYFVTPLTTQSLLASYLILTHCNDDLK